MFVRVFDSLDIEVASYCLQLLLLLLVKHAERIACLSRRSVVASFALLDPIHHALLELLFKCVPALFELRLKLLHRNEGERTIA